MLKQCAGNIQVRFRAVAKRAAVEVRKAIIKATHRFRGVGRDSVRSGDGMGESEESWYGKFPAKSE